MIGTLPRIAPKRLDGPYALALGFRWAYGMGADLAVVVGRPLTDADQVDLFGAFLGGPGGPVRPLCALMKDELGRVRNVAGEFAS